MKNLIRKYALSLLVLSAAVSLSACDDWTEPERLDVEKPDLEQSSPELYAEYLEALRSYKQRPGHKVVYAWFDNSRKNPSSRGQHLSSVPDSIDVVALMSPDNLAEWETEEMDKVRTKGTRVIYTIGYADLEAAYAVYLEEFGAQNTPPRPEARDESGDGGEEPAVPVALTLSEFAAGYMPAQVALCDKYGYDGISVAYDGMDTSHLSESELAAYLAAQSAFLDPVAAWKKANPSKLLVLEGLVANIRNAELVWAFDHIILQTQSYTSTGTMDYEIRKSSGEGIPADRFVLAVSTPSLDVTDKTTGYFGSQRALTQIAYWMCIPATGYTKAGIAVYNVQNDYYHVQQIYKYTREAIAIMN